MMIVVIVLSITSLLHDLTFHCGHGVEVPAVVWSVRHYIGISSLMVSIGVELKHWSGPGGAGFADSARIIIFIGA